MLPDAADKGYDFDLAGRANYEDHLRELRPSRLHDGFQNLHRISRPVSLTFLKILGGLPHSVGHMGDTQDIGLAHLSECAQSALLVKS